MQGESPWVAKCSQDTALRNIKDLLELRVLIKNEGGGRSSTENRNIRAESIE